ncbi:hypothetical protein AAIB41_12655 [Brucella sp. BE17]|uniref:hypothetical protein n=1 Tax=Brucella sp. BE17 TaxID=3142977 RepID=UPI0031BB22A6
MMFRFASLLALGLILISSTLPAPVWAQDASPVSNSQGPSSSEAGTKYKSQCWRHGVDCSLVYGDKSKVRSTSSNRNTSSFNPSDPVVNGPLAIFVVLGILVLGLGLWMRFGNGGVLLSSAPREMKQRQGEAPESWRTSEAVPEEGPEQFLQKIAAMEDKRQALVQLLRRCLLHAADVSGTRLFRSDTERTVLGRLPQSMPNREQLENLLVEAELVHYGGRDLAENQFSTLLTSARALLSQGRRAYA